MRDFLPGEAEHLNALLSTVLQSFRLGGYCQVGLPAFEYQDVISRGLDHVESHLLLRFVEPETGEVVALRPDMTPQVARFVATHFRERTPPFRLSYHGSILRRRPERARHEQQMLQAGIELVGAEGFEADLEIIERCVGAIQSAGLQGFVVDLGHGAIATTLLERVPPESRRGLLEALARKDQPEVVRGAEGLFLSKEEVRTLAQLVELQGGREVFAEAARRPGLAPAIRLIRELARLFDAILELEIADNVLADLGETRVIPYYTGFMFQVLAEGPGQAVVSGGRYDELYAQFGPARPAAGGAIHLDHLRWALGPKLDPPSRVLVGWAGRSSDTALRAALGELRGRGISAAPLLREQVQVLQNEGEADATHIITLLGEGAVRVETVGSRHPEAQVVADLSAAIELLGGL